MIKPAVLDAMVAAGCTVEQIAAAVKADQAQASGAERQARYRARKASLVTQRDVTSVTSRNDLSPKKESPQTPKEKTTPISSEDKSSSLSVRDFFSEFMVSYPRREGSNPRKPAKLTFERLVAKGADPERLIAAAQALAREHPTPTRFVPQAVTFLNQERFADAEPIIPGESFCASDDPATRFHVIRFRNEHDGHDPPDAIYGGRAGYMIPASWVKAMQMRQANGN